MKAVLSRVQGVDQSLKLIQDAIQTSLDQTTLYQPKAPAKWANPAPTTLFDAIDRLAALLVTLNSGTPIP